MLRNHCVWFPQSLFGEHGLEVAVIQKEFGRVRERARETKAEKGVVGLCFGFGFGESGVEWRWGAGGAG